MQHNKKLLAAAVAGAFAVAPAMVAAQTSTVQIGGTVNLLYYISDPNNGNVGKKGDQLENSENNIYVAGEENLGGGLSLWFRCESSADEINGSGVGLCTRNSGVGFKGRYGNVFAGNWDTPIKLAMGKNRGWFSGTNALYGGSATLLFGGTGVKGNPVQTITGTLTTTGVAVNTVMSSKADSFFRRQSQLISYHSPSWNGFGVMAAYSAANEHTGLGGTNLKPRLWSFAGTYTNGPVFANLSFERHTDYNPGNQSLAGVTAASLYSGGDDDKWMIGGGYRFANNLRLSGLWTETDYQVTDTTNLKIRGWAVYADWKIQGPHSVRAQYASLDDTKGSAVANVGSYKGPNRGLACGPTSTASCAGNTGADMYTLVYAYQFSKRTSVGLSYNRMSNDSGSNFSLAKVAATTGGSQSNYGMFINHRF